MDVAVLDDDCVIHDPLWLELALETMRRDPTIGLVGLKRVDLPERPDYQGPMNYRTRLHYLPRGNEGPHKDWHILFEEAQHVIGTAHILSGAVIDAIGGWYQHDKYGFDDSILCERVRKAGWRIGFIPQVRIEHWDPHPAPVYQKWKSTQASAGMAWFNQEREDIRSGRRSVYYAYSTEAGNGDE
jgi:GT2 family glycosyltransferase